MIETERELEQWGRWVRSGGVSLGANSIFRLGSTVSAATIIDDRGIIIDQAVARLKLQNIDMGTAVQRYYVENLSHASLAERMKTSKNRASCLHRAGVAWVDGVLNEQALKAG